MFYQDGYQVARLGSGVICINLTINSQINLYYVFFTVCPNNHPCCVDMVSHFYAVPVNIFFTMITDSMFYNYTVCLILHCSAGSPWREADVWSVAKKLEGNIT